MKKILLTLMLVVLTWATLSAYDYDFKIDNICYKIDGSNVTVTSVLNPSYDYYNTNVTIPSEVTWRGNSYRVTAIGDNVFSSYKNYVITNIVIPEYVTVIGQNAFTDCVFLSEIVCFAKTPPSVDSGAFQDVEYITLYVPYESIQAYKNDDQWGQCQNILPIGNNCDFCLNGVYFYITEFNEAVVSSSATGEYVVESLSIPENVTWHNATYPVTRIDDGAFAQNSYLWDIWIPNSIKTIGYGAFRGCSYLQSIWIPNSVTMIDGETFLDCTRLSYIEIPNSVEYIGSNAFANCDLTSVFIPNSVKFIESGAFSGNSDLMNITVDENNAIYDSRENCNAIIKTADNSLVFGCQNTLIPNSVTSINEYAFEGCYGLRSVTIPNSVTSIGGGAFSYCRNLTSCEIPNSVTYIGWYAFHGCSGLTSINIPNSVTTIGNEAFKSCIGLTRIGVEDGNPNYDSRNDCNAIIETSSNTLLYGCMNTVIPNSVTSIGNYAFYDCSCLTSIVIPDSVTTIGNYAFYGCRGLTSMTIGNSVTSIGNYALYDCSCLTSIVIPDSVTTIGDYAFCVCNGLTSMTIGNSVTSIGNYAFYGCRGLTSMTIGNSVTSIGYRAFYDCRGLTSIVCLATTPPSTGNQVFYTWITPNIYNKATLFVPAESFEAYQSHAEWGKFTHIVPFIGAGPGDINGDGNIAISDVTNLIDQLLSSNELPAYADVNGDGVVTIKDVTDLIDMLLSGN